MALPNAPSGTGGPNNSSPKGQLFYANFTQSNSPAAYNVYAVDQCNRAEGAPLGNVTQIMVNGQPLLGQSAIEQDMAGGPNLSAQCFRRPH